MTLSNTFSLLQNYIDEDNHQLLLIYLFIGSILVIFGISLAILAYSRPPSLNWYEKNVLDLSKTPTKYVHRRTFARCDTEDDRESVNVEADLSFRKQSRIVRVNEVHDKAGNMNFFPEEEKKSAIDISDRFTIPKAQKVKQSMFSNLHHSQFDRGLYQCTSTMPDSESCYDEESIGTMGSIQLSLYQDSNLGILTVTLKQALDIPSKRQDGNPNPYFRVALDIPDSTEAKIEQQTTVYKNTVSPTINEDFCFQTSSGFSISGCRLEVKVYDYDQFSVDECVGYCWLTLGRVNISTEKESPTVFWAEVLPYDENGGKGFGEVLFSLTYLSKAQRLMMNVFKTRNLLLKNENIGGYIFIRVNLLDNAEKRLKRKKTASKKNSRNTQFNECLNFTVPKNALCDSILQIEALHEYGTFGMGNEVVGRMELPLHKCKELWRAIIREERSQARWYPLEEP